MHSNAYVDEAPQQTRYQPLRASAAYVAYSEPQVQPARLSPEKLREQGRTRKSAVHGKTVAFMRLSPSCKVNPIWNTFWHEEYESEAEAKAAARLWEDRISIAKPGFTGGQA